jgi:SagB-type dehydrogenase family enzyme
MTTRNVDLDGVTLATLRTAGDPRCLPARQDMAYVASRFAWLRREGDELIAETSLTDCAVTLEDRRSGALFLALGAPRRLDAGLAEQLGVPLATLLELGGLLLAASLVLDPGAARREDEPPLALWEFHDLLFHSRSRLGRYRGRHGQTFRLLGRLPPPAALPAPRWPETVALERPGFEPLASHDPPMIAVQSARHSVRDYDGQALTRSRLGEFLFRVGRVEDHWESPLPSSATGGPGTAPAAVAQAFAARPYPSGGAMYPLELYLGVRACAGLDPGLWHYEAGEHRLARVSGPSGDLSELIDQAGAGMDRPPEAMQILIVLTARVPRVAWSYESIAYELVLKDVGIVLETMYLVATAMALAPCALGVGDSDLFARASGVGYYHESAVAEFALGSSRARGDGSPPARRDGRR